MPTSIDYIFRASGEGILTLRQKKFKEQTYEVNGSTDIIYTAISSWKPCAFEFKSTGRIKIEKFSFILNGVEHSQFLMIKQSVNNIEIAKSIRKFTPMTLNNASAICRIMLNIVNRHPVPNIVRS